MREISLHLLDIAENSVAADGKNISIHVHEDLFNDRLSASVIDDGRGMDAETAQQVQDPFYTTRTTRNVGLGDSAAKEAEKWPRRVQPRTENRQKALVGSGISSQSY